MNCDVNIYTPDLIDEMTLLQLAQISNLPGAHTIYGLPDIHAGYGFPIGSVSGFTMDGIISPNGVGYDINCGVSSSVLNIVKNDLLDLNLGNDLFNTIPSGMNMKGSVLENVNINLLLDNGLNYLNNFFDTQNDFVENNGSMKGNSKLINQKAKARGLAQLGSIGSGNHYLELQYVDKIYDKEKAEMMGIFREEQVILTIHTGSRGLGKMVCEGFVQQIKKNIGSECGIFENILKNKNYKIDYGKIENLKNFEESNTDYNKRNDKFFHEDEDQTSTKNINEAANIGTYNISNIERIDNYNSSLDNVKIKNLNGINESKSEGMEKSEDIVYAKINSSIGQQYYTAMCSAANYAFCNRSLITNTAIDCIKKYIPDLQSTLIYDVCHNIASLETHDGVDLMVHRKGASKALGPSTLLPDKYKNIGQPVLVGGSMGTASYILLGNNKLLTSSCHGAGRIVPRKKSHNVFEFGNIIESLNSNGIEIKYGSEKGVVEEAPGCYKDIDLIADYCEDMEISKKIVRVKPFIVIKG